MENKPEPTPPSTGPAEEILRSLRFILLSMGHGGAFDGTESERVKIKRELARELLTAIPAIEEFGKPVPVSGEGTGTLTRYAIATDGNNQPIVMSEFMPPSVPAGYLATDVDATLTAKEAEIQLGIDRKRSIIDRLGELENELQVERDAVANLADRLAAKDAQLAELRADWQLADRKQSEMFESNEALRSTLADLRRQGAEKTAWLVGLGSMPPMWWTGRNNINGSAFTTDANLALRFARQEDAERVIAINEGLLDDGRAEEHIWG